MGLTDILKVRKGAMLGTLAAAGVIALGNFGKTYETECETYQGYHDISDGERIYVFDPQTIYERGNRYPERALLGNPPSDLDIGESYRLKIKNPVLGQERIVSAEKCE